MNFSGSVSPAFFFGSRFLSNEDIGPYTVSVTSEIADNVHSKAEITLDLENTIAGTYTGKFDHAKDTDFKAKSSSIADLRLKAKRHQEAMGIATEKE